MPETIFSGLASDLESVRLTHPIGRVCGVSQDTLSVKGLSTKASVGDQVVIQSRNGPTTNGEVLSLSIEELIVLPEGSTEGLVMGDQVVLIGGKSLAPSDSWIGRVIDPSGKPLDGKKIKNGPTSLKLKAAPPNATERRPLGERLETGMAVFNTLLPIVKGQRIGLFSGSGVGKSTLLSSFAKGIDADIVVVALIGERGREVREFVENVLGPEGMKRAIVVAATSDQSPLLRRQCAFSAMTIAEYFRDQGLHVLLLADSITRFAEAHRETALASGEEASLRGFPPSTSHIIMGLCERAGPGSSTAGDITAVFTVLVAGSDMEEPIADILRGVLDGHIVLERSIAERGRFPAIDLLKSVSRSLPRAATDTENLSIQQTRQLLGAYERVELMIQAGLYTVGNDPLVDHAVFAWPQIDSFLSQSEEAGIEASFEKLNQCLASES